MGVNFERASRPRARACGPDIDAAAMSLITWHNVTADMLAIERLRDETAGLKTLGVLSHVGLLLAVAVALRKRFLLAATILAFTVCVSLGYHVCASFEVCGGVSLFHWRMFDHVTANLPVLNYIITPIWAADVYSHDPFDPLHDLRNGQSQRRFVEIAVACWTIAVALTQLVFPFTYYVAYVALITGLLSVLLWAFFFRQPAFRRPDAQTYVVHAGSLVHLPYLGVSARPRPSRASCCPTRSCRARGRTRSGTSSSDSPCAFTFTRFSDARAGSSRFGQ
jgi:lysylphosphatidylglycerol synthetase-like protein (DUF2156 family)